MPSDYNIQAYLLDKSNITDVIQKQEVYAPECILDYAVMFGGEPVKATNKEWAEEAMRLIKALDSSQHYLSGVLVQLPQPGVNPRPEQATAIANGGAHMVRHAAEDGSQLHNGGRQEYELVRLPELEERGENPRRIQLQKVIPLWMEGNHQVAEVMKGSKIVPN